MNSILMTDFYKATHMMQYREGITHFTSYLTPRGSRFDSINGMVVFGIANFVNEHLIKNFNENFFDLNPKTIEREVADTLCNGLGYPTEMASRTIEKIMGLYKLRYLPIELNGLPEGTICPMGVPAIEIRSTHRDFAWVAQSIESLLSCEFWHPAVSATIGHEYAKIAKAAYKETVDDTISYRTAMCDFSMRGQESNASAVASGAAFLASFNNCSTIQSREYVRENYCDEKPVVMGGLTSTEHSVMCSDFAICGDERETYRRLLTEVYPNISFAAVCDSHDFWNVVTNILPSLREEIEAHNGFLGVRHDSDEPIHALCGIEKIDLKNFFGSDSDTINEDLFEDYIYEFLGNYYSPNKMNPFKMYFHYYCPPFEEQYDGEVFEGVYKVTPERDKEGYVLYKIERLRDTMTWEDKGMVQTLYELFGGYTNGKGYKVINPKLKAVYGDSITLPRAKEIYRRLKDNGFAANNVSLGVGSFSMQCLEEDGILKPFTRDSFSIAVKATYCTYINENGEEVEIPIFKNPKGCEGKKSLKGLCRVVEDNGSINVIQELDKVGYDNLKNKNLMVNYFINGVGTPYSFNDIRERLEENIND